MKALTDLTYKKKNGLLLAGSICFFIIVYFMAIKKTVILYNECSKLTNQEQLGANAPQKIALLEKQLISIENIIGNQVNPEIDNQQLLLEFLTNYCEKQNITLKEFPKPIVAGDKDFIVETNIFVVEGNFIKLLNLIYSLEQKQKIGNIASIHFKTKKNYKTKRMALTVTVYLQNIKHI